MTKKALVTGGSRGIGKITAKKLQKLGYDVTVIGRDFSSFNEHGIKTVVFDISDIAKINDFAKEFGDIDVLVNNAGIDRKKDYDDYPKEDVDKIIDVNIKAPVQFITAFAPVLKKNRGRVINVASQAAEIGHRDIWYGITKAGLVNVTKSFSEILGGDGVIVNAVAPGPVETEMIADSKYADRFDNLKKRTILGRIADPAEIADVIVWLATESPEYLNGETIDLNNGAQRIK